MMMVCKINVKLVNWVVKLVLMVWVVAVVLMDIIRKVHNAIYVLYTLQLVIMIQLKMKF